MIPELCQWCVLWWQVDWHISQYDFTMFTCMDLHIVFFGVCVCIRGPKLAWNLKDGDWTYHEALSSWQCFSLFMMYSHRCVSHAGFDFPYAAASWDYAVSRCFPFSIPSPYLYSSIVYIYITSIHATSAALCWCVLVSFCHITCIWFSIPIFLYQQVAKTLFIDMCAKLQDTWGES